ncbi:MAG: SRPBCC family protein [Rhizomicrobium sp.]
MRNTQHATFTIERTFAAPVAMVFEAWASRDAKARWFSPPVDWKDVVREHNFYVGGCDRSKGTWPDGHTSDFKAQYWDIVPNARIVYVYDMHIDGKRISVSLATVEFEEAAKGTRMTVTEQGAFLDGYDDGGERERGTNFLMDKLVASVDEKIERHKDDERTNT